MDTTYKGLIKTLAEKVGKFVSQEAPSTNFVSDFYRVRVEIDVRELLKSKMSIIRGGKRAISCEI
jgi:hypothetical protein